MVLTITRQPKLASDAFFLSGLIKIETEESGKKQEKWRPKQVFHYIQWKNLDPIL